METTTKVESRPVKVRCREILSQLGRGINGAMAYIGADPSTLFGHDCYDYPDGNDKGNSFITKSGLVDGGGNCWIRFKVNGKKGERWEVTIALEWSDVYTVYLQSTKGGKVLWTESRGDVYCDMLKDVVEKMYDTAIDEKNEGWITFD
jgi:hypothetical protein